MEIKKKEKTLAGLFLRYVALLCINTFLLTAGVFWLTVWAATAFAGFLLPANHAEVQLSENAREIRMAQDSPRRWIPGGCSFGVYDDEGKWLEGSFEGRERQTAWAHYEKNNIYVEYKSYYRFIPMENGNICIVRYQLIMKYASEWMNELLPAPEVLMPVLDGILFLLNAILLSRSFAKKVRGRLRELQMITEKIAENDLEFETGSSDIREINEIMASLGQMKDTLQDSLKMQWDMEKQRQEQLSALAHDIKTPLTIIRGNAELLGESGLSLENQECVGYILTGVEEIERYLESMKRILRGTGQRGEEDILDCESLGAALGKEARKLAMAARVPIIFEEGRSPGQRRCCEAVQCGEQQYAEKSCGEGTICTGLTIRCHMADVLRAFGNIVSNGAERTDRQKGLVISISPVCKEKGWYLRAAVRDYGPGFSPQDLQHADQEFYSGDVSRHDRRHQGLGLSIAKRFALEQGGFLKYGNREDGPGAEVALWLKTEKL